MGENEQGGMLRTVVVLGLVAIIASALVSGLVVLKGQMASRSNQASNLAQTTLTNAVTPQALWDSNWQTANLGSGEDVGNIHHDGWSRYMYNGGASYAPGHNGSTGVELSKEWAILISPSTKIPNAATKATISFWTNGPVQLDVFPVLEKQSWTELGQSQGDFDQNIYWRQETFTVDLTSLTNVKELNFQICNRVFYGKGPITVSNFQINFS